MSDALPQHIAIIMDGNGRWAKKRFLPRVFGHQAALKQIKNMVRYLSDAGVQALTLYAFSTENWKRPQKEVRFLMELVLKALNKELQALHKNNVRFRTLGDCSVLPEPVQAILSQAKTLMADNTGLNLNIALNYGGRAEIMRAIQHILHDVGAGRLASDNVTEAAFESYLYTHDLPDLDLMIRTGGERRISNFLLWQSAYTELYFTDILFPDFNLAQLEDALAWYKTRERRYGKTSEQLTDTTHAETSHPN